MLSKAELGVFCANWRGHYGNRKNLGNGQSNEELGLHIQLGGNYGGMSRKLVLAFSGFSIACVRYSVVAAPVKSFFAFYLSTLPFSSSKAIQ
jgi:hypothetical protein